jgi:hypothetical protein
MKVVGLLGPALLLLALREPRLLLGRGGGLLAGGFLLGSLPAWLFYVVHGDHAGGTPGSVGNVLRVDVDLSLARLQEFWKQVILGLLGTYHWRPNTALRWAGLALNSAIYGLALVFALGELARGRRAQQPSARRWGLRLLLLTLAASLGAVYFSRHTRTLTAEVSRYALPAYIPLLVAAGALVTRVSRRSRAAGAGLLAFLLLFAGWTHVRFLWPLSPTMRARESAARARHNVILDRLAARPVEALYVDHNLGALVWAFLLARPVVSALTNEVYGPNAVAADAAERIDVLATTDPKRVAANLAAVGAAWESTPALRWRLFEDVRVSAQRYRLVPRRGWRVAGDPRVPASVADGDLATAWPLPRLDGPLEPFAVDLGREHVVARVIFWPSRPTSDVFPLRVSGSGDGIRWDTLGVAPAVARRPTFVAGGRPVFRPRNGWLELVVTPRPLRYLRVEPGKPVGNASWGVAELQVYEATDERPADRTSVEELVERLRAQRLDRLLADPVVSARVSRATRGAVSTLVANGLIDNHGAAPPDWLARPVELRAQDGLLVPNEDVPELGERLEEAGTHHLADTVGDHALVRVLAPLASTAPCRPTAWRASMQDPTTNGSDTRITLEAALVDPALISGVRLWYPPKGTSRLPTIEVTVSLDGRTWQAVDDARPVPEWGWAGRTLFAASDGLVEVILDPTPAHHVRVVVESSDGDSRLLCVRGIRATGPSR